MTRLTHPTTARGIRAAVPFWAMCVATGRAEMLTAYAAIHASYTAHVWRGGEAQLVQFEARLKAALSAALGHALAVADDIGRHEAWMARERATADANAIAEAVWGAELADAP